MLINSSDYSSEMEVKIKEGQLRIIESLISKIGSEASIDDNLNGTSVLMDLVELKEIYHIISHKEYIESIFFQAFPSTQDFTPALITDSGRRASLSVLVKIVQHLPENLKREERQKKENERFSFTLT